MLSLCHSILCSPSHSCAHSTALSLSRFSVFSGMLESAKEAVITSDFLLWIFVVLSLLVSQIKCALVVPVDETVA